MNHGENILVKQGYYNDGNGSYGARAIALYLIFGEVDKAKEMFAREEEHLLKMPELHKYIKEVLS
jgi:hypothetical protein